MSPKLHLCSLCLVLAAASTRSQSVEAEGTLLTPAVIESHVASALKHRPSTHAARARVDAGALEAASIPTWEPPQVLFGGGVTSPKGGMMSEDGDLQYGVEQSLPLFGKARASRRVALEEMRGSQIDAENQVGRVRLEVSRLLIRLGAAAEAEQLTRGDGTILQTLLKNAEARHAAGRGAPLEILSLQGEISRQGQALDAAKADTAHLRFALNQWTGGKDETPGMDFRLPPPSDAIPYSSQLVDLARRQQPGLRRLLQEVEVARARSEVARLRIRPDFSLGVEGRQYSGDAGFREGFFTVGLTLPWFNRTSVRNAVSREQSRADAAQADAEEELLQLSEQIHALTLQMETARRAVAVHDQELLPRIRRGTDMAVATWTTHGGALQDVMMLRRSLQDALMSRLRSMAAYHESIADLVRLCGTASADALQKQIRSLQPAQP